MPQFYGDDLTQTAPSGSQIHIFTVPTTVDRDRNGALGLGGSPATCRVGSIVYVVADQCYYRCDSNAPTWTMLGKDLFGTGVVSNAGALTGVAPTGAQVGVDTLTGDIYYVDGAGNWQPVPSGVTVSTDAGNSITVGTDGGAYLAVATVTVVSADANNLIDAGTDGGAHLEGGDLVSGDAGNSISVGTDGALFAATLSAPTIVSADANNLIDTGTDGGAHLEGSDIVSSDVGNSAVVGTDGAIFVPTSSVTVVSSDANNLIDVGTDSGAHIEGADLVSSDAGNDITVGSDGALFLDSPPVPSTDANNCITAGTDGGPFLDAASIVSADATNIAVLGTDGKVFVPPDASVTVVSADANNDIVAGSDGGAYLDVPAPVIVSADANNLIDAGVDGGAHLEGADLVSADAGNTAVVGTDGAIFVPPAGAVTIVSADANNCITAGSDNGAFLEGSDLVSSDSNNGIATGTDGKLYVELKQEVVARSAAGSYELFVSNTTGSDVTGDGSVGSPYATARCAFESIPHRAVNPGDFRSFKITHVNTGVPYPIPLVDKNYDGLVFIDMHGQLEAPLFQSTIAPTEITSGVWRFNIGAHSGFARGEVMAFFDFSAFGPFSEHTGYPVMASDATTGASQSPFIDVVCEENPSAYGICRVQRLQVDIETNDVDSAGAEYFHKTNAIVTTSGMRVTSATSDSFGSNGGDTLNLYQPVTYSGCFFSATSTNMVGCTYHCSFDGFVRQTGGACLASECDQLSIVGGEERAEIYGLHSSVIRVEGAKLFLNGHRITLRRGAAGSAFVANAGAVVEVVEGKIQFEGVYSRLMYALRSSSFHMTTVSGPVTMLIESSDPTTSTSFLSRFNSYFEGLQPAIQMPASSFAGGPFNNEVRAGIAPAVSFATFDTNNGANDFALASTEGCSMT